MIGSGSPVTLRRNEDGSVDGTYTDSDGVALSLSGVSITAAFYSDRDGDTLIFSATTTVLSTPDGTYRLSWDGDDVASVSRHTILWMRVLANGALIEEAQCPVI